MECVQQVLADRQTSFINSQSSKQRLKKNAQSITNPRSTPKCPLLSSNHGGKELIKPSAGEGLAKLVSVSHMSGKGFSSM